MGTSVNEELQWVYLEKQMDGWSKEIPIPLSPLVVDGQELKLEVAAIANDGKTLIVKSDYLSSSQARRNYLAVIQEEQNGWGVPEIVGDYKFQEFVFGRNIFPDDTSIFNSEDGRVVAVQQTKRYFEMYGSISYDGYVFIRNDEGKWIKNNVNSEGVEVMQSMLLSGDGSTLLWNPSINLAVPFYSDMK